MTDPTFTPETERELVAVFADGAAATRARAALVGAGVGEHRIRVDDDQDTVAALRAEMHEELTRSWTVPNAAVVYPGTSARGLATVSVVAGAVAVPAAFALAAVDLGASYWVRLVIWLGVLLTFAFTLGLVIGPSAPAQRPGEPAAPLAGSVLRVRGDSGRLRRLLAEHDPVRIDELTHDGRPIATVAVDTPDTEAETLKDIAANASGDDYHPQR